MLCDCSYCKTKQLNKLHRKCVWSLTIVDEWLWSNSPHMYLCHVDVHLKGSEMVSLPLPRRDRLKYLTVIANKKHLVKWTEFIFLVSSSIVLWPPLIFLHLENSSTVASGAFLLYLVDYRPLQNLRTPSITTSQRFSLKVTLYALELMKNSWL